MMKVDENVLNKSNDDKRGMNAEYVEIKIQEYINLFSSPLMEKSNKKTFRLEYINRHKKIIRNNLLK